MEKKATEMEYPSGIKWTKQRRTVYQALDRAEEPLSAVQIYSRVCGEEMGAVYAVSTVYRILAAFEEKGLVTKSVWMGDGTVMYELNRGGHTHYAVCLECHRRIALASCPFDHIHLEEEAGGFTVTGHKLELYGYCRECGEALRKQDKRQVFGQT